MTTQIRLLWQTQRRCPRTPMWAYMHPRFRYRCHNDSDMDQFMRTEFPWAYGAFRCMPLNVMRADMWRYAVMYRYGGVYVDADSQPIYALRKWVPLATPLFLLREGTPDHASYVSQWFFVSLPRNPVFLHALNETVIRTRRTAGIRVSSEHFVHHYTGPAMFTDVVARFYDLRRTHTGRGLQTLHGIVSEAPPAALRMEYAVRRYVLQGSAGSQAGGWKHLRLSQRSTVCRLR